MATAEKLLTAEEYFLLPDEGQPTELVRGMIVPVNTLDPRRGQICSKIVRFVGNHVNEHQLGHVVSNHASLVTERDPDTVRGMDVAFFSYQQIPPGPFPEDYLTVAPRLVFAVPSPADRWRTVLARVTEFLKAGSEAVCVLDPATQMAYGFDADLPPHALNLGDDLAFPEILNDFRVPVYRLFDAPPPLTGGPTNQANGYHYLEYHLGGSVRQPCVKGRKTRVEALYWATVGEESRTPEEVAADFEVPLGAVLEAIRYCQENEAFLNEDRERQMAVIREYEKKHPPLVPPDYKPEAEWSV